jgi:hypothetical protein
VNTNVAYLSQVISLDKLDKRLVRTRFLGETNSPVRQCAQLAPLNDLSLPAARNKVFPSRRIRCRPLGGFSGLS